MDNITHSLFALTLARTRLRPAGSAGRATTAVLLLSSNVSDIDIVAAFSPVPGSYLAAHRGPTHGPLGLVSLALVCAALASILPRLRRRVDDDAPPAPGFVRLTMIALLGVTMHVAMDLPTPYGTRLLSPFSSRWYALDWLPIISIPLWIVLAAGLALGRMWPSRHRVMAAGALILMVVNYAAHAMGHAVAVRQNGGTTPWRVETWNGERPVTCDSTDVPCVSVAAIPSFAGPFAWRMVRPIREGYELVDIDVWKRVRSPARVAPNEENRWTDVARTSHLGAIFYAFARFPAATVVPNDGDGATVRIRDVRYTGPTVAADERSPFIAVIAIESTGHVQREILGQ